MAPPCYARSLAVAPPCYALSLPVAPPCYARSLAVAPPCYALSLPMPIIGARPQSGIRIDIERASGDAPPWVYKGHATTPDAELAVVATIDAGGAVDVALEPVGKGSGFTPSATDSLAERTRLLLRAAFRHARADGTPPPRRVQRWRPNA